MQFSRQPAWGLRRRVAAAATFGLTVVLAVTATSARSATAGSGTASLRTPCAHVDGLEPVPVAGHQADCPPSAVASVAGGSTDQRVPEEATRESGEPAREEERRPREAVRTRPAAPGPVRRTVCTAPYVLGNPLLGAADLPRTGYLGTLLFGYIRYGGLSPAQFLAEYRTSAGWVFPPDDGYARNSSGTLLRFRTTLFPGQYADRFGNEFGRFLGAGGSPFIARALPPDSVNTQANDPAHVCNYHLYRIVTAFDVDGGPAAPWFEQPGGGLQYTINPAYLPAGATPPFIPWLVDHGYLKRVY